MKKKDLMQTVGVSATSMVKIIRGENVQTAVLVKVCRMLNCDFADIVEILSDERDSDK